MNAPFEEAQKAKDIFLELVSIEEGGLRQAALDRLTGDNTSLRNQVLSLLQASDATKTSLLDRVGRAMGRQVVAEGGAVTEKFSAVNEANWKSDSTRPTQIGHYKLMEQIGEGGMGTVYVAQQHTPIRRMVALKLIKPGMDSKQVIARFAAERQALAMMNHPNIARVLDAGTADNGLPYFVMELVRGVPITDYCEKHKLDLNARLALLATVCDAVQHAHQKGIIHRDLKPSNVLVEKDDVRSIPKVIDFGIAKATQQPLTESTVYTGIATMIGTPMYMSPEQADLNSLDVDTRSDVYSLGVC